MQLNKDMWRGTCLLVATFYLSVLFGVDGGMHQSRHKRSWMMPGTLWCGAGSTAENFTNLGVFSGVDLCCREHDYCFPQIQSFEFLYGIRNYRLHTVSHCDCDLRFRQCLQSQNDTISTLVGMMFFNILEMPCFTLREEEQCVDWHWWGGCKRNGSLPKAELQKPPPFNYSSAADGNTPASLPQNVRPVASLSHKRRLKPLPLAPSAMNSSNGKKRLPKKQKMEKMKAFVMDHQGITADSRDTEETEKKRLFFAKQTVKHSFHNRTLRTRKSHRRKAGAQMVTVPDMFKREVNSLKQETTRKPQQTAS
ncbi:group 3 secretory phospholipase A2 [Hyperolius riggenbachi]|uniref:group 3 secretory phospholipase A2 n=1 Tax=Hyperolius riggenbachi TaxID=752182 RepID=UPI0035A2F825